MGTNSQCNGSDWNEGAVLYKANEEKKEKKATNQIGINKWRWISWLL